MKSSTLRRVRLGLWIASGLVIVISAVAIVAALARDDGGPDRATDDTVWGLRVATPLAEALDVPAQTAPDTAGNTVPLVDPEPGTLSLVYFGYTHCPDICPLDMAALAAGLRELPADQRDKIRVVFATVDPERDTPDDLRAWLDNYDPAFIGVTPPIEETNATLVDLGYLEVQREDLPSGNGYVVSHPGGVFVFTGDGKAHVAFFGTNPPADIAHDLTELLDDWAPPSSATTDATGA